MSTKDNELLDLFARIAPHFHKLSTEVLFGDVWQETSLNSRDRSLITVAALVSLNRTEQLPGHLERALMHGLSVEELSSVMTHLAFYAGWPAAASAIERLAELNSPRGCQ